MDLSLFEHEYDRDTFVQIQPDGKLFKMWTNEHCWKAYQHASFEEYSIRLVSSMVTQLACFIDVGAHHGYYSLLVGSLSPDCEIFAFEPVIENFLTLKQNLDENNVVLARSYNCAISDREQTKDFYISTASDNCSFIVHPTTPTKKIIQVHTYPLDHFYKDMPKGPTLIKIDIDGHELEVLDGMQEIINTTQDLKLLVEFNPKLLKIAGHAPEEMLIKLDALGFDLYLLSDADGLFFHLPKDAKCEDYLNGNAVANILCLRKQPRINFLFFSHSAELNGAERSLLEQVEYFTSRGNMCTVVVPALGPMIARLKSIGAAVLLGDFSWWCSSTQIDSDGQICHLDASFAWLLENIALLQKINPDVLFTNTTVIPWGALAAAMLGKPHIWSVTEFGDVSGLQYFIPFADVLKMIVESSNFILTNSDSVRTALFDDLEPDRAAAIYRTVALPAETMETSGVSVFTRAAATHLILVGTISPLKNQRDAVMAVNELISNYEKDVELIIIGSTASADYRHELLALIQQYNLPEYIHLMDFQENIFTLLQQTDIALTCAHAEPFGRTTLEAMLCGKPVVGVNRAGTAELIQEGITGLLYEPGDYHALAERVAYLCDHPEKRTELGENGLMYAQTRFAIENTYERALQIAFKVTNQPPVPSSVMMALILQRLKNRTQENQQAILIEKEQIFVNQQEYIESLVANQTAKEQILANQHEYISSLLADKAAKEQTLANQREYIASLLANKAAKEQILVNQQKYIASLLASYKEEQHLINQQEYELHEIYKSKTWRFVSLYRRWKEQFDKKILHRIRSFKK